MTKLNRGAFTASLVTDWVDGTFGAVKFLCRPWPVGAGTPITLTRRAGYVVKQGRSCTCGSSLGWLQCGNTPFCG